ncbi:hypothetical protein OROHE_013478 [Orobanche hederae]
MQPLKASIATLNFVTVLCLATQASSIDTLIQGDSLNSSSRLVSARMIFTLGFHTPQNTNNSYIAVWHTDGSYPPVWIGNRENPIPRYSNPILTLDATGKLIITHGGGESVEVYSGGSRNNLSATLLDTGNFVVTEVGSNGEFLWQSFDHPTDTLLPGMKLGFNRRAGRNWTLTSWFEENNPAYGAFTLEWDPIVGRLLIRRRGVVYWTSGKMEDSYVDLGDLRVKEFENIDRPDAFNLNYNFTNVTNGEEAYFMYTLLKVPNMTPDIRKIISGWRVDYNGDIRDTDRIIPIAMSSVCYGYKTSKRSAISAGCQLWEQPTCRNNRQTFVYKAGYFSAVNGPESTSDGNSSLGLSDCREICWDDCQCVAYAPYTGTGGCVYWRGTNVEFVQSLDGTTNANRMYVLETASSGKGMKKNVKIILGVLSAIILLVSGVVFFIVRKLQQGKLKEEVCKLLTLEGYTDDNGGDKNHNLRVFTYASIQSATRNFSSDFKLGQGGFGPVYKVGITPALEEEASNIKHPTSLYFLISILTLKYLLPMPSSPISIAQCSTSESEARTNTPSNAPRTSTPIPTWNDTPRTVDVDNLPWDPSERPKILSYDPNQRDEIRRLYWLRGPCQPRGHVFPTKQIGSKLRRFVPTWFDEFHWLEYSVKADKAYCLCCYLFKDEKQQFGSDAFVTDGFNNWAKKERLSLHVGEVNSIHNRAQKNCEALVQQNQSIVVALHKQTEKEKIEYRMRLNASIDVCRLLLKFGLPFRGHDESETSLNQGLFLGHLEFLGDANEMVRKVILDNAPRNCQLTSPRIQKDIANCFAEEVIKSFTHEIGNGVFSLLVDESSDISRKEQMATVLRYVDARGHVKERFVGLLHVTETSSETLKSAIDDLFAKLGLSLKQVRGQGYDGASNMRGEFKGLKALVLQDNSSAYYVHCFAHQLQLVVVAVAKDHPGVWKFFEMISLVCNVVNGSCKRKDMMRESYKSRVQEALGAGEIESGKGLNQELSLTRAGDTRWGSHQKSIMGKTPEGQDIAVKLLSRQSGQGLLEFKTELILISKLQHVNLVKLIGFCIHGDDKMIIYDYMHNKSLDCFLFSPSEKEQLDWQKRVDIIEGIAQGLLCLHKYSRVRIIHRDLKPSNILLDENMIPKISDFGLARIFKQDISEANTNRRVGTYGYMAPEYAMQGIFSVKSDVYSFGVLVLEIASGRKNNSFHEVEGPLSLVEYAWGLWRSDSALELMDPTLRNSYIADQVHRCIHIGLLCVENYAVDRPTIEDVILMLKNEMTNLPMPKNPSFIMRSSVLEQVEKSMPEKFSVNELTLSEIGGR